MIHPSHNDDGVFKNMGSFNEIASIFLTISQHVKIQQKFEIPKLCMGTSIRVANVEKVHNDLLTQ